MNRLPPTIDMLPDGSFRTPQTAGVPLSAKLLVGAVLVAAVAVSVTIAALAVWVVSMILPVLVVAVAVAWGMMKWRRWQSLRRQGGPVVWNDPRGFR